jgi:hypothetical protein
MKTRLSNFLKSFLQSGKLYFLIGSFIYILFSFVFFIYNFKQQDFFRNTYNTYFLIIQNLEKNFQEKNLSLSFKNGSYETNQTEPILLVNYNSKISTEKNLLYINKKATTQDFKDKETFAIMNENEININIKPEPLVFPLKGISMENQSIDINHEIIKNYLELISVGNYGFYDLALKFILPVKMIEILILFIVANLLVPFLTNSILRLSGYIAFNKEVIRRLSFIVTGSYMAIKTMVNTFLLEISPINILIILTITVSILAKSGLDKRIHLNN